MSKSKPIAVDLFCGAGGLSLGFEQAGFNVRAAFDLENFNVQTHKINFPDCSAFAVDLSKQSGDSLRILAGLGSIEINVIFGGPPCQGFSTGGRQDVNDERNLLLFDFARLVGQLRPQYFVVENVKGLMSARSRPILDSFARRVKRTGYQIVEPIRVLNASDFGVPQRRWRTFILGYRQGLPAPSYPDPRKTNEWSATSSKNVVRDAISDLPNLEDFDELFSTDVYFGDLAKPQSWYARIMRGLETDPKDQSGQRGQRIGLTGCLRTMHSHEVVRRFSKTRPGASEPISRYIRLAWDHFSPTIRAGTGRDHGSHTAPRPIHPERDRCISSREAARLHSFPDWFQFHGTRWHDFRQIGNSVPPLLGRAVAKSIYDVINSVER